MRGIHRWPVNSLHKLPVTRKMFPFDDVIMQTKICCIIIGPLEQKFGPSASWRSDIFLVYFPTYPVHCIKIHQHVFVGGGHHALQWRHNGRERVSNHQPHDCLLNRLFRRRSRKTPKLRVTGLCEGISPGIGEFPAQRASNAENISIWWRHHDDPAHRHVGHMHTLIETIYYRNVA